MFYKNVGRDTKEVINTVDIGRKGRDMLSIPT